jgi:hypothetical protein
VWYLSSYNKKAFSNREVVDREKCYQKLLKKYLAMSIEYFYGFNLIISNSNDKHKIVFRSYRLRETLCDSKMMYI